MNALATVAHGAMEAALRDLVAWNRKGDLEDWDGLADVLEAAEAALGVIEGASILNRGKVKRTAPKLSMSAEDFWKDFAYARGLATAMHGPTWYLTKGLYAYFTIPKAWAAPRTVAGMVLRTRRDWTGPARQFWPGGKLPAELHIPEPWTARQAEQAAWIEAQCAWISEFRTRADAATRAKQPKQIERAA